GPVMEFLHFGLKVDDIAATSGLLGRLLGVSFEPIEEYAIELDFAGGPEAGRTLVTHGLTERGVEIELVQAIDGRVPDTEVLGTSGSMAATSVRTPCSYWAENDSPSTYGCTARIAGYSSGTGAVPLPTTSTRSVLTSDRSMRNAGLM